MPTPTPRHAPVAGLAAAIGVTAALTSCTTVPDEPTSAPPPGATSTSSASTPSPSTPSTPSPSAPATPAAPPASVEVHATGLDAPWSIAFLAAPDAPAAPAQQIALVSERDSGRVLELAEDGAAREVGVIDGVVHRGEGGLLGIAVDDGSLYTYLTTADDNRIVRYDLTGRPGSLALGDAETILAGLPSAANHNGGRIAFGPDGMLYATVGDAGDRPAAQDVASLAGKILRLTPDGAVPDDNPFPGSPVYSYGHRNPQGLGWDGDGTLYASEFGQDTWDELNVIRPGGNYGWPEVEGIAGRDGYVDPVQQWAPADASPSGLAIADGAIYVANLRGQRLRVIPLDDLASSTERLVGEHGRLRDVALAPDGTLWVLTNNTDGRGEPTGDDDRVLRLTP
ncbi:MAG: glucose dehydrogenase [Micrococcales bacterium 73-15]|mgnify:CR=1 FL=1|uniref:PQQ-dependent sugar dehydrogenase n=1 Tax=Salana multivorans TaxID=120377 RepID=UPI00096A1815|nr:PQQ-dependent sugar dehydrogenase [Salana multivorans]OJX98046.1 MAG: glucose dehydrogenase [Micrococcales bacterium 73-15]